MTISRHDGGTVARLAQPAREDCYQPSCPLCPSHPAVVADALEDAGCDDAELFGHLRSSGTHVRGCWAVDLLTYRS